MIPSPMLLLVLIATLVNGCGAVLADCQYGTDPLIIATNPPCYRVAMNGSTGKAIHQIVILDDAGHFHTQEVQP